jgi:hypothetical protein
MYQLAKSKQKTTPTMFIEKYMLLNERKIKDSSDYYELGAIMRRFPKVESIEDAIRILQPLAPTLFNSNRIVLYSNEFAERIYQMLIHYDNLIESSIYKNKNIVVDFIDNFYESERDFKQVMFSKLFLSTNDLQSWLQTMTSQNVVKHFTIKYKIENTMNDIKEPFIYQDEDEKLFIIQNVIGGNREKALTVADIWNKNKINIGYEDALPIETEVSHMVFTISPSYRLLPIDDKTKGATRYLSLLYFGQLDNMRYAAILELL